MGNIVKIGNVVANNIERISSVESYSIVRMEDRSFIQDMDNLIIAGSFNSIDNTIVRYLCKINSDGSLDSTFDIGTGFSNFVYSIEIQNDGKILVGGTFFTYNGVTVNRIVRLNTDGSLDSTFVTGTGFNVFIFKIAVQNDGKILVGGSFTTYKDLTQNRIVRLNTDGSLDSTFDIGTGFNNTVREILIQNDGKILVGGNFTTYKGLTQNRIVRLNTDGSVDATFDIGTGFNNSVGAIEIQNDGKFLLVGSYTTYKGLTQSRIARLNTDGSLDSTFGIGTGFDNPVTAIKLQTDGKILIVGTFFTYNGVTVNRIVRLNTDGSRDFTFVTGTGFNGTFVNDIAIQSDGKIIVGGDFTTYNGLSRSRIIRLDTNGVADKVFPSFNSTIETIKILSDEKILLGGNFSEIYTTPASRLLKINSDNSLDLNFNLENEFNSLSTFPFSPSSVFSQLRQTDGKFIFSGSFTTYKGLTQNRIVRLNVDDSVDSTFLIGTGFNNDVNTMVLQTDGKIIIGGNFTTYKDLTQNRIARLNSDGSLDSSFVIGTGFNASIRVIKVQTDGKILLGGDFTTYKSLAQNRIIRLNTDGSLDSSFVIGTGFDNTVNAIEIQTDGKILVGGNFTTYKGLTQNRIVRLNTDGSLDSTFTASCDSTVTGFVIRPDGKILICGNFIYTNPSQLNGIAILNTDGSPDTIFGTGFNNIVNAIEIQNDGKILVGGSFTTYKGLTQNRIVRINPDGSLDSSFDISTGFNNDTNAMAVQSDYKILVGGSFTTYKGLTQNRIVRINPDGSLDSSFDISTGFNNTVKKIVIQTDSRILMIGDFTTYKGLTQNYIARLNTDGSLDSTFNIGTGFNSSFLSDIVLQTDGKVLVCGNFTAYNGSTRRHIVRINTNGSVDSSFNPPSISTTVRTMSIQTDGKILIGGDFGSNAATKFYLERLNTNGTVDSTFNISGIGDSVYSISQQDDGKILVLGNFTTIFVTGIGSFIQSRIARFNIDGSLDRDFNNGGGFNQIPYTKIFYYNNKILFGGLFTTYSKNSQSRIALLNGDGSLDTSFNIGTGFDSVVNTIMIQSNGKILAGGTFTRYKGLTQNRIIRINSNGSLDVAFPLSFNNSVNSILKY